MEGFHIILSGYVVTIKGVVSEEWECLKGHSHEKMLTYFLESDSAENKRNIFFNTLHHKIIYDKKVFWMNDVSLLAIALIICAWLLLNWPHG